MRLETTGRFHFWRVDEDEDVESINLVGWRAAIPLACSWRRADRIGFAILMACDIF